MTTYQRPGWFTTNVANRAVALLTRLGISAAGAQMLIVRGRRTGQRRSTPVNPLTLDRQRYLVAPRGETEWVRNLRAVGQGVLQVGKRRQRIRVAEVLDAEKPPILRAYLRKWKWETGMFFDVSDPEASEDDLRRIAPRHPIFRIVS